MRIACNSIIAVLEIVFTVVNSVFRPKSSNHRSFQNRPHDLKIISPQFETIQFMGYVLFERFVCNTGYTDMYLVGWMMHSPGTLSIKN